MSNAQLDGTRTDEELIVQLAQGGHDALGPLYGRYGGLIFHLAARSLGRALAEEVVQEVFLTVWRTAGAFDPAQGAFRPWLMRLVHWRILNELRRRGRRPSEQARAAPDATEPFQSVPDQEPGPEERAWQNEYGQIVRSALDTLPPKQRQAVALAFLEDLTHEQVAQTLDVPLGTAKTRIRSGLALLRLHLAPVAASLLAVALAIVGVHSVQTEQAAERDSRALSLVTTSDLVPLRLTPATADLPAGAHASYRGRPGNSLAVLTSDTLPALPAGRVYQAWAHSPQGWISLGTLEPGPDGSARLIAESPVLASPPDALEITVETGGGSQTPSPQVELVWPSP